MGSICAMCDRSGTSGSIELPAEALRLMVGGESIDIDEVTSTIRISFCKDHWSLCEEFVTEYGVNPLTRCLAKNAQYRTDGDQWSEKVAAKDRSNLVNKARSTAKNGWDSGLMGSSEVASKIVLWTLDAIDDEVNARKQRLLEDLQAKLRVRGFSAVKLQPSEATDLLATLKTKNGIQAFAFKVVGLDQNHPSVRRMANGIHFEVDSIQSGSMSSLAKDFGATPVYAVRWKDDPQWYIADERYCREIRDSRYFIVEKSADSILMRNNEVRYTPLPTLDSFPEAISSHKKWEKIVKNRMYSEIAASMENPPGNVLEWVFDKRI